MGADDGGRRVKAVLGYVDPWSAAPGERLRVHVGLRAGAREYSVQTVRVICADGTAAGPGLDLRPVPCAADGVREGHLRTSAVGSYARAFVRLDLSRGVMLGAFVRPTLPEAGAQTILRLRGDHGDVRLEIDAEGRLAFRVGAASVAAGRLAARTWCFVWGAHDPRSGVIAAGARPIGAAFARPSEGRAAAPEPAASGLASSGAAEAVIAAALDADGRPHAAFNGKIEHPFADPEPWEADRLHRYADAYLSGAAADPPLCAWDFSPGGDPDAVASRGRLAAPAAAVNLPDRAVKGVRWTGDVHGWRSRPDHYAAAAFHDDDLGDAGWPADFELTIPDSWSSGVYALELRAGDDATRLPFFVRPPRGRATAPLAVLASTYTTMAYANRRYHMRRPEDEAMAGATPRLGPADVYLYENADVGPCLYDTRADGSGVRQATRRRPLLNAGPDEDVWNLTADTHLLAWLDRIGQAADVITDEDLHAEGASLLARYACVITGSHPEYVTTPMRDALDAYLAGGGRLMALGGNGFYWRIAVHPSRPDVIELRRAEGGARFWAEEPGEHHMAFTGELGGLWRRSGRPPNALVGVGSRAMGFDAASWYVRTPAASDPRAAFIFEGVPDGERIGDSGLLGGGAAGWEIDAADVALGTPAHALVVARSEMHDGAMVLFPEEVLMPHAGQTGACDPSIRADMVFFETPGGGVFAVGSMTWLASLPCDGWRNAVARVTGNVLRRFLDPAPLPPPPC